VYEDFLPVSAAGIFRSNLGDEASTLVGKSDAASTQAAFEAALGTPVQDEMALYAAEQAESIAALKARCNTGTQSSCPASPTLWGQFNAGRT
jgi:uncharacterized glyoxalase superfamily metalloenzyme YdcJ